MTLNPKIDIDQLKIKLKKLQKRLSRHLAFATILGVLLIYLLVVWRISQLASAEPSSEAQDTATIVKIPKIDKKAIEQIQKLEQSSPELRSLFNAARNDPFHE